MTGRTAAPAGAETAAGTAGAEMAGAGAAGAEIAGAGTALNDRATPRSRWYPAKSGPGPGHGGFALVLAAPEVTPVGGLRWPPRSVRAAEQDALAVRGRAVAANAGPGLRLAVQRDAARCRCGQRLDLVLAVLLAAVERARPTHRDRVGEVGPGVDRARHRLLELAGPAEQERLEVVENARDLLRRGIQRDRLLTLTQA